ncbi:MAG: tRNA-5-methyluridine54 2-sulfurtransferase [Chloroflexota bacterium]|nr:tRNA-5-methyluridine54 2-sulfurtransferase [Chloroflexota bacterium]
MRCRKCGEKAVINMRQHRLALCAPHYLEWLPQQTERFIKKYEMFTRYERLLLAVSGGKDSLALWDVLWKLGYSVDGLYINLGIDNGLNYSDQSQQFAQEFADARGLNLIAVNVQGDYGESIPQIAQRTHRGQDKTCSVCGLVKRHIFNQAARDGEYDAVITAHNLDDEAAVLLANSLGWSLERLGRGQPLLPAGGGFVRKAKPFCRFSERETAAYALLRGIAYIQEECPFSTGSKQLFYKRDLNRWEDHMPGTKLRFYLNYLTALDEGAFPDRQESPAELAEQRCPTCGQPTITGTTCAFCRLFEK